MNQNREARAEGDPTVSIIVPTYNRQDWLQGTLASVVRQEFHEVGTFEVVVVDNGSTDSTAEVVSRVASTSRVPVRYVLEESEGVAQARNRGILESRGEWLAFIDDDELADVYWLISLFNAAKMTRSACVGGAVHIDLQEDVLRRISPRCRATVLREKNELNYGAAMRRYRRSEYPGTDNMMVARAVFDALGFFDEKMLRGGSDHDFSIRMRVAGIEMWYVPSAIVRHRVSPNRLTSEYFRWDAIQGGAQQSYFDFKYKGTVAACLLCAARIGHATLVNFPLLAIALLSRKDSQILDCRTSIHRLNGYVRGLLPLVAPNLFSERALLGEFLFRRGRDMGSSSPTHYGI